MDELQITVLKKILENGDEGVTIFDFPKSMGITEELLDAIIDSIELELSETVH